MCAAVMTLKASSDFQRLSRQGRKWTTPSFIMLAAAREDARSPFRLGLTVSKRVGNAVIRNRVKRRLRAMVRAFETQMRGFDLVLIAKAVEKERDMTLLRADFLQGLRKLEMLS